MLGSTSYVEGLSQAEKDDILAMLNFDMIGSPNFARYVYDGDGTAGPEGPGVKDTSRTSSSTTSPARVCSTSPRPSTGGPTTGRSSPRGSRPAACSPARSSPRPRPRSRSTGASPALSSTPATTLPATRSPARATVPARRRRARSGRARPDVRCRRAHDPALLEDEGRRKEHSEPGKTRTEVREGRPWPALPPGIEPIEIPTALGLRRSVEVRPREPHPALGALTPPLANNEAARRADGRWNGTLGRRARWPQPHSRARRPRRLRRAA